MNKIIAVYKIVNTVTNDCYVGSSNDVHRQTEKGKEYQKKYKQSEKGKESQRKYQQSEKCKERQKKYQNQTCVYNGETLTLDTLRTRFRRAGIPHPTLEAKKFLLDNNN